MLEAALLITLGLIVVVLTIKKPDFYWASRRARLMRSLIGDQATVVLYLVIALVCIGAGVVALLG